MVGVIMVGIIMVGIIMVGIIINIIIIMRCFFWGWDLYQGMLEERVPKSTPLGLGFRASRLQGLIRVRVVGFGTLELSGLESRGLRIKAQFILTLRKECTTIYD